MDNKLIPMTQFVLEQAPKFNPLGNDEQVTNGMMTEVL